MAVRAYQPKDAAEIAAIYNHYVDTSIATFDTDHMTSEDMAQEFGQSKHPHLVYESDGMVIGYAHATEWKSRCAYSQTVETSVYLHPDHHGKGIGTQLYRHLLTRLEELGIHAVIGGISLPNDASVHLHEKFGYKKIGQFHEVGYKFNKRIDVGYWQKILNQ